MKLIRISTLFSILLLGIVERSPAQDYTVQTKAQRINNVKYSGYLIHVEGPLDRVEEQVLVYLKDNSKVRRKRNYYLVSEFKMKNQQLDSTLVYVRISEKDSSNCTLWMAANSGTLEDDRVNEINGSIEGELVVMARSYYVHEQELKIQEAETAAQIVSKQQQNIIEENERLTKELADSEARKIELENLLEENRLKIEVLKQKIIDNTANQTSTYDDLQKVNQVIQRHKEALKRIK